MNNVSPRELLARDTRIVETREEIRLCFGGVPPAAAGSDSEADTISQIILTPAAAKRLSLILGRALTEYESLHGDNQASSRVFPRQPSIPRRAASIQTDLPSGINLLTGMMDGLGVFYEREDSFKIFQGAILDDRILLGFNYDDFESSDTSEALLQVCRNLGMPERFQRVYRERLPESNIILFGYEGNEQGGIWKAYLEFSGDYVTVSREPGRPASSLIHLGFKWDAADNRKAALARYTCYPELKTKEMLGRVRDRFYGSQDQSSYEIVHGMVERAAATMSSEEFLYLEVEEEGNPRRSYDINMYRAGLSLRDLYSWLREACRIKGIGPETFHRLYEPVQGKIFGHVSGGHDRDGLDFLTFYYGAAAGSR